MHRDKTVARILLILSVVHVAAAAPAIVRQRSQDVDEDVRPASEKRGNSGNTPRGLYPVRQVDNDRTSASGTAQLDNDPPPASEAPHDPPPASEAPHGPPPASGAPHDPPPASGAPHDPPPASGTPQLDNDPQPASGASHPHNDPLTAAETSSAHDDPPFELDSFDSSYRFNDIRYVPSPDEEETPPNDNHLISHAPSVHESEASTTNNHLINYTMTDQLKRFAAFGVFGVAIFGFIYGLSKLSSVHSKPNGRDLTSSSDVVGRGVSTHPRLPRKLVSRALANLRNEDLRLLSVLTRRALERLD